MLIEAPPDAPIATSPALRNAHVQVRDGTTFFSGNTIYYLHYLRDAKNGQTNPRSGQIPLPARKVDFDGFVSRHGGASPRTLAFVVNGAVSGSDMRIADFLRSLQPGKYFCKPDGGIQGKGAFRLDVDSDVFHVNGELQDAASVAAALSACNYLVQVSLTPRQHPDIARFNRDIVSTLRLVTFAGPHGAKPVSAHMRLAAGRGGIDNWHGGGVAVPVDIATGRLDDFGVLRNGLKVVDRHPLGEAFGRRVLPHYEAALRMACHLHDQLGIASLGWDIALLESGPCIIECNRFWGAYTSVQLNAAIVDTFLRYHLPDPDTAIRFELAGNFRDRAETRHWISKIAGQSLASGRLESLTPGRLAITLAGTKQGIQTAMRLVKQLGSSFALREMKATQPTARLQRLGLDLEASVPPSA
jgi:hypothetical protein